MRHIAFGTAALVASVSAGTIASNGAPPPPAFMIYFESRDCKITPIADQILEGVAVEADLEPWTITIVGHADTIGAAAANQLLSECRAKAAMSSLVSKGVDERKIAASGRGESELLVQTADGVAEPQNRRATITLKKKGPQFDTKTFCRRQYPVRRVAGACADSRVIARVAECARSGGSVRISGHTQDYSDELKRGLAAQGIPEGAITAHGGGPDCAEISIAGADQ
jgi:hypothetical protein